MRPCVQFAESPLKADRLARLLAIPGVSTAAALEAGRRIGELLAKTPRAKGAREIRADAGLKLCGPHRIPHNPRLRKAGGWTAENRRFPDGTA